MAWRRVFPPAIALLALLATVFLAFWSPPNICGEQSAVKQIGSGTSVFLPSNSGISTNSVRTVTMDKTGAWLGYAGGIGVSHFNGRYWRFCTQAPHVNAIAIDGEGRPWVGTDAPPMGKSLLYYNGKNWEDKSLTPDNKPNLPDYRIYSLTWVENTLYVGTYRGVGQYIKGRGWTTFFYDQSSPTTSIFINESHVHAVEFVRGQKWLGTINAGVINIDDGHVSGAIEPAIAGNNIRKIAISPRGDEVWFASDPGGITVYAYADGIWTKRPIPGATKANDIRFDPQGRPCVAATDVSTGGVYCLGKDNRWQNLLQQPIPTYSVAFGCRECAFDEETFVAGTVDSGLIVGKVLPH